MQEYTFKISEEDSGKRLDLFLADFCQANKLGVSRTQVQRLLQEGKISVEGLESVSAHYKLKPGHVVRFIFEEKKAQSPVSEDIPLKVVFEDEDLAIIDKPRGLVVHPAPGNYEHTLVNALLHRFKKLSDINPQRPGIVHRLDKETSGLLVIAKNNAAHLSLSKQFSEHSIKRKYIALVKGRMEFEENIVELPIGRHPHKRKNMSVGFGKNTKYAKTRYRTLKRTDAASLLELEPFTGRTHQLRVHLSYLGHPILGDTKYGRNNEFTRLALHAKYLGFEHPTSGRFVEFSSPLPKEFEEFFSKNIA
ncbi:MAG: RluA family pseudouridine synthase [Candidatus Omnitrophica bacterium]|nr:RluA family pseudouridine synthase [Candidatus Omnitrophota bacterium]